MDSQAGPAPRRVALIGAGGSGKSTLARRLGQLLDLPVVHLDRLHWRPGWTPAPEREWLELQRRLVSADAWVIDGNYGATMDLRLRAADLVVFLDLPTPLCLWRIARRRLAHRGRTRADLGPGCPERLTWEFVRYVAGFRRRRRPLILRRLAAVGDGREVVVLGSRRQVRRFVVELGRRTVSVPSGPGRAVGDPGQ